MLASCQFDPSSQFDPHGESEFQLAPWQVLECPLIGTNQSENSQIEEKMGYQENNNLQWPPLSLRGPNIAH